MSFKDNTIYIGNISDMGNADVDVSDITKEIKSKWDEDIDLQFNEKMSDELENVFGLGEVPNYHFDVNFADGSKVCYLFFDHSKTTAFEQQELIRTNFEDVISKSDNIKVFLNSLHIKQQETMIKYISSCAILFKWNSVEYSNKESEKLSPLKYSFICKVGKSIQDSLIEEGEAIAVGTNIVRTLAVTPSNKLNPKKFRKYAMEAFDDSIGFSFVDKSSLKNMNAGAFLSVIRGTKNSHGGIAKLSYTTNIPNAPKLAVIGKGITFDTGGYNIKTDGYMADMHRDMTGAAAALGVLSATKTLKLPINLDVYLAIGENLVSEKASRPNDVISAMDGTTIEIVDTDAEGRLVLADTILYSKQQDSYDNIITMATLTGAAPGAIGTKYSCVFSNSKTMSRLSNDSSRISGERCWGFPLTNDFTKEIQSEVADITQCSSSSNADHIFAASFLKFFVDSTEWLHIDLSSEHCSDGLGLVNTDVTGFGVRWGVEMIKQLIKERKK